MRIAEQSIDPEQLAPVRPDGKVFTAREFSPDRGEMIIVLEERGGKWCETAYMPAERKRVGARVAPG